MPIMSSSAFFSDALSVLERTVEVKGQDRWPDGIEKQFEVDRCVKFISENEYKKVALQFPDDLLPASSSLAGILQSRTSAIVFILGDTSYGSCCVDEVAAQHAGADAIIHYGSACLSPTKRFPVLYVFGRECVDLEECCSAFRTLFPDKDEHVLVLSEVMYMHAMDEIQARLQDGYQSISFSSIESSEIKPETGASDAESADPLLSLGCECSSGSCCSKGQSKQGSKVPGQVPNKSSSTQNESQKTEQVEPASDVDRTKEENSDVESVSTLDKLFGRRLNLKAGAGVEDYKVFYIGSEGRTLTNFMMTFNKCAFSSFDPATSQGRQETLNVSRALMRRYHLIEKAKDANVVGIVAGTLGVANYLDVISRLKKLLRRVGKKCYTFAVGKLNVPKLANFMEVDVYVLVACPENSLIDSKEFYRPVVTPFEMEIACNEAREWTGEYITDFQKLLPGASSYVEIPSTPSSMETADVSLITGKLRSLGNREEEEEGDGGARGNKDSGALVKKDEASLVVSQTHRNASEFLAGRTWQGLNQKLGETPVTKATEGRRGIAGGYTHENS